MIQRDLNQIMNDVLAEYGTRVEASVIFSNRPDLCDYQWDGCFRLAKLAHKSPMAIGQELITILATHPFYPRLLKKVEIVAPGFINFTLSDQAINNYLNKMYHGNRFAIEPLSKKEMYFLDYGGPNVAKPLHVGHLRPAIIGESLKRILNYRGHKTIGDVHLGDYGLQIGEVIYGILKDDLKGDEITLAYLEETYPKISKLCKEDESILKICSEITKKLQDGDKKYHELFEKIKEISVADIKRIYDTLEVHFDLWYGESDAYDAIPNLIETLKPYTKISNQAKIIDVKKDTDTKEIPPLILEKSNGAYLYATTDLATILKREEEYHPDHILYVVDARQSLHFEQVFRVSKMANLTNANLEHIGFGTMNGSDGKPFKTRNGDMLKLDDLLNKTKNTFLSLKEDNAIMDKEDVDKIVGAIIKYADLQNNREKDYIFDIEKFSSVVGKTGPYILYTYLRIQKVIDKEGLPFSLTDKIYNIQDRNLRLELMKFEDALNHACDLRLPSYLADFVYNLCVCLNAFYQNNHIATEEDLVKKQDWLSVLILANKMVKKILELLVISIPSKM